MILTQSQIELENSLRRILPPGVISCWIPDGHDKVKDVIGGNIGDVIGTHPNVPVISKPEGPNLLTDGGLNIWTSPTNLTNWGEQSAGASTINKEATDKIEGAFSCKLYVDADNNYAGIHKTGALLYNLIPNKRYKLIVWYKNSVAGKIFIINLANSANNFYLKEDGAWHAGAYNIDIPNSLVWKKLEVEFNAHADYSSYNFVLKRQSATSSSIYFDNISIKEIRPSLINPSVGWVFDGVDDYVEVPNDKSLQFGGGSLTAGFWAMRYSDTPNGYSRHRMMEKWQGGGFYIKWTNTGHLEIKVLDGDANQAGYDSGANLQNHIWEFIVAVIDRPDDIIKTYINTTYIDSYDFSGDGIGLLSGNDRVRMGGELGGSSHWLDGLMTIPFVAKGAWSQQQVNNVGNATKSLFSPRLF